ncbi:MAG: hypothetical protein JNM02_06855 [Anaerolineales bacterium]|nr:hypothetical protein [Anaerolineales bacterium]
MEYLIRLDEENKIVIAVARGEWDSGVDDTMIRRIMEMVDTTGMQKVLLDIRELRFKLPMVQIFERAKEMRAERQKFNKTSAKAAIVYSTEDTGLEEDMLFFETAARNRSLPYQVFKDVEEAMDWLLRP